MDTQFFKDAFFRRHSALFSLKENFEKLHSLANSVTHSNLQYGPHFNPVFDGSTEIHGVNY